MSAAKTRLNILKNMNSIETVGQLQKLTCFNKNAPLLKILKDKSLLRFGGKRGNWSSFYRPLNI